MAQEVIKKSGNLISQSQVDEVKRILQYLKSRNDESSDGSSNVKMENLRPKTAGSIRSSNQQMKTSATHDGISRLTDHSKTREFLPQEFFDDLKISGIKKECINDLDNYIEKLYEDMSQKIVASSLIYKLTLRPDNLHELTSNETLLCALTRVLREDSRRSLELSAIITGIFASFAEFTLFHPLIIQYKIGSQCLDIIQAEIQKEILWFKQLSDSQLSTDAPKVLKRSDIMSQSSSSSLMTDHEKSVKKYQIAVKKQNYLLSTCFAILYFMSEDQKIEQKMVNKNITLLLIQSLNRYYDHNTLNPDVTLLILVITFLRKLSIYVENKDLFIEHHLASKVQDTLSNTTVSGVNTNLHLTHCILGLLINMSFDPQLKQEMMSSGLISKIISLWSKSEKLNANRKIEQLMLQLLYQMTRGKSGKISLKYFNMSYPNGTDSVDLIMSKFMKSISPDTKTSRIPTARSRGASKSNCMMEMMSLFINLSLDPVIAKKMSQNNRLNLMMDTVYKTGPQESLSVVLLQKVIRNMTSHDDEEIKQQIIPYVDIICEKIFTSSDGSSESITTSSSNMRRKRGGSSSENILDEDLKESFVIESIGILSNLTNISKDQLNWYELFQKYQIYEWMEKRIKTGSCSEDDLVLEIIMLISTASFQKDVAQDLVKQNILQILSDVISFKQEDDEIVLQVIFTLHVMIRQKDVRKKISSDEKMSEFLLDLLDDKNHQISSLCKVTLEILSESNEDLMKRFRNEKFKIHNKKWIEMKTGIISSDIHTSDDTLNHHDLMSHNYDYDEDNEDYGDDDNRSVENYNVLTKSDFINSSLDSLESSKNSSVAATPDNQMISHLMMTSRPETAFASSSSTQLTSARPQTGYKRRQQQHN